MSGFDAYITETNVERTMDGSHSVTIVMKVFDPYGTGIYEQLQKVIVQNEGRVYVSGLDTAVREDVPKDLPKILVPKDETLNNPLAGTW